MKNKIIDALERLYKIKEYGYANPIQTRPHPEPGFTGEDPMSGDEAAEEADKKVEEEKKKRKDELEKNPGDISKMRPTKEE